MMEGDPMETQADNQEQDISGSTMYLTDIAEEGDRFGIAKGPDGAFHAISKRIQIRVNL